MYTHFAMDTTSQRPPRRVLVTELYHAVRLRNGKLDQVLPPGRHRMSRRRDRVWYELATDQVLTVPSQEVITGDGATVRATVALVVQVTDPVLAMRAGDWRSALHLDVQLALRQAVTSTTLDQLLAERSTLDAGLLAAATERAAELGVTVKKLALRDLVVPGDLKRVLADVVEARLMGQASLERARGETAALRSLANAAGLVRDNPSLFQLRLLQQIEASEGHTFVIGTDLPATG
ncbi:MAG: slipin family protein [Acidimicrobiia bacterium]|nr:slipin family protein [Acidimicrobiia bacterium]